MKSVAKIAIFQLADGAERVEEEEHSNGHAHFAEHVSVAHLVTPPANRRYHHRPMRVWLTSVTVTGSPAFLRTTTSARRRVVCASSGVWSATSSSARCKRAS